MDCGSVPDQKQPSLAKQNTMKSKLSVDFYEFDAWQKNLLVCGVDEVGRGCLAGPVVVAAAILPHNTALSYTDSKKMNARARDKAYEELIEHCWYSVVAADPFFIEKHNIYQATRLCMRRAVLQMAARYPHIFAQVGHITVDAMPLTLPESLAHHPSIASFPKGEDFSRSIAAASIIAKVTRDRLMQNMDTLFPRYRFGSDKAYASPHHCETVRTGAATFIHRPQFIATVRQPKKSRKSSHEQRTLFSAVR